MGRAWPKDVLLALPAPVTHMGSGHGILADWEVPRRSRPGGSLRPGGSVHDSGTEGIAAGEEGPEAPNRACCASSGVRERGGSSPNGKEFCQANRACKLQGVGSPYCMGACVGFPAAASTSHLKGQPGGCRASLVQDGGAEGGEVECER